MLGADRGRRGVSADLGSARNVARRQRQRIAGAGAEDVRSELVRGARSRGRLAGGRAERAVEAHAARVCRSEEHTSELQSLRHLVCRLLLEKKKKKIIIKSDE